MKLGDAASGLLSAMLGVAVVLHARTFPPMPGQPVGPSLFPILIGAGLLVAGENRHGGRRHHACDGGQRWEEERDGHQQRHRHRGGEPWDRAYEQPKDRRRQDGAEYQRIEHLAKRAAEVLYQAIPSSMPQGSGTRSSV